MRLLEYCAKPFMEEIASVLAMGIGLEISLCTGNAQRISLWEALRLAFPNHLPTLDDAYANGDSATICSFLANLQCTGLDMQDARMLALWPFSGGLPQVLRSSQEIPEWTIMIEDTAESACFAVASRRCLVYTGSDRLLHPWQHIRSACSTGARMNGRPIFQATLELHPYGRSSVPLPKQARIRIQSGCLEIRNTSDKAQLAFFFPRNLANRTNELWICAKDGNKGHTHRELYEGQGLSQSTVTLCIADCEESKASWL